MYIYCVCVCVCVCMSWNINSLNAELKPIFHLLALLEAHHILHVSRIRVKEIKNVYRVFRRISTVFNQQIQELLFG